MPVSSGATLFCEDVFWGAFVKLQKASNSFILSVCLSFRMELGSYWTDFQVILHLGILRKFVDKIRGSLKSDRNNGYFTCICMNAYDISRNTSQNELGFRPKL
jgi:hypothetical protein